MNGLDDFEKSLAAEKAEREKTVQDHQERRHRKHRHHHRHDDRNDKDREDRHRRRHHDDDGHRHKRSRHSREDGDEEHRSRHRHHRHDDRERSSRDSHHKRRSEDDSTSHNNRDTSDAPVRDAWMTAPSAIEVEHIHRAEPKAKTPPQEPKRVIHSRELNHSHLQNLNDGVTPQITESSQPTIERKIDYTFGDSGSSWRMTKLRGVYTTAETSGKTVEEVATERYGSLQDFDDAREEKEELERRKIYGPGYKETEKPTGHLYQSRQQQKSPHNPKPQPISEPAHSGTIIPQEPAPITAMDKTSLNRLRAQMMKAKLRNSPDAANLEQEYNRAASLLSSSSSSSSQAPESVVLSMMDTRQLAGPRNEAKPVDTKRGRSRGLLQENDDMTIADMVREERRTKTTPGGEGLRLAERIAKDGKFTNDLDYMDDNAAHLAKRVHKSEISLKNTAIHDFQKLNRILDRCPLCHHDETSRPPLAPVVSLATRVFLTLPTEPELVPGGALIVPLSHRTNLLECDDDEWEEMRNFMKALTRMYHHQGRDVLFYENAAAPRRHFHAAMVAVPIPYDQGAVAPAYFREAFCSADEEWAQHKKVIDTGANAQKGGMGRMAFRKSLAREMPYFHVWFSLDGGLGHVVEDADKWPAGDRFAREVVGGIVAADPAVVKRQGRWRGGGGEDARVEEFRRGWRRFDWTGVLV